MRYTGIFNDGFRSDEELKTLMDKSNIEKHYTCLK